MDYFFYNTDADAIKDSPKPRFGVLIDGGFAAVGGDRTMYGEQLSKLSPGDNLLMYENEVGFVAAGNVREAWDGITHDVPKYYHPSEMEKLAGGAHEYRIAVDWFLDRRDAPLDYKQLQKLIGYTPRGTITRVIEHRMKVAQLVAESIAADSLLPGDISSTSTHTEGSTRQITVNAYERSSKAVRECKSIHGTECVICGFDFGTAYGSEFSGFIHVHHLRPLSEIGESHEVDPKTDLQPVCPNCHAVIHYGGRLRSIEEVRKLLNH